MFFMRMQKHHCRQGIFTNSQRQTREHMQTYMAKKQNYMTELEAVGGGLSLDFSEINAQECKSTGFMVVLGVMRKMPKRFPEFLCHFTFPPAVCDLVHPHACQHLVCCSFYSCFWCISQQPVVFMSSSAHLVSFLGLISGWILKIPLSFQAL